MKPTVTAIVAVSRNGVIGANGQVPWRIPSDLAHFRSATRSRPVIVGRRTWDSMRSATTAGERRLVVISKHLSEPDRNDVVIAPDPASALTRAQELLVDTHSAEIIVAGGAAIYDALWPMLDKVDLTIVDAETLGDTRFDLHRLSNWTPIKGPRRQANGPFPDTTNVVLEQPRP